MFFFFFIPTCLVIHFSVEFASGSCLLMSLNKDVNQLKSNSGKKNNVVGNCVHEQALM